MRAGPGVGGTVPQVAARGITDGLRRLGASPGAPHGGVVANDDGCGAQPPVLGSVSRLRAAPRRVTHQLRADNVSILSAAVAFYLFLALIPSLGAVIAVYGLVASPSEVAGTIRDLTVALPAAARELVVEQVTRTAGRSDTTASISLALGVAAALFSASQGTQALVKALNLAYNEEETRGVVRLRVLSLALTASIVAVTATGVAAIVVVGSFAAGLPGGGRTVAALRWPALGGMLVVVLSVLYQMSPDRHQTRWRWVTPGAVVAATSIASSSLGLSFYTSRFAGQAEGVLGAVGVLLAWLFATSYLVLLGAEIDADLERHTTRAAAGAQQRRADQRVVEEYAA